MPRSYRHIEQYEEEILKLRKEGYTRQQVADNLGLTKEQIKNFVRRYNNKQRKLQAGVVLRKKGRPPKTDKYNTETTKVNELKYIIARKDARIKSLEMENELMRDFLSLTGRK